MVADILELYHQSPKQFIGGVSMAIIAVIALYLFMHERYLRKHLADLQPDRRILFLIHQWQLRNFQIIFGMVLLASAFIYVYPEPEKPAKTSPKTAIIEPSEPESPTPKQTYQTYTPVTDPEAVLDLFDNGHWQAEDYDLNELKTAYENALIGGYILHNCKRSSESEIKALLEQLREDIIDFQEKSTNAQIIDGTQLYSGIISAAEGSYEMIYRRSDCDSNEIDMLEQQFAHFMMSLQAKRSPAPATLPEGEKSAIIQ